MRVTEANRGKAGVLVVKLKKDYKMSQREVAEYCGVNQCVVNKWAKGLYVASDEHLDKLREALVLLAGRNVRYQRQALDILMGRE